MVCSRIKGASGIKVFKNIAIWFILTDKGFFFFLKKEGKHAKETKLFK